MEKPVVSVIMPAYNAEKFIAESINSVIRQTYNNWELLIVDDGSTDNTKDIIKSFCNKDARIKYYYQQNGKQGKARNLALAHAAGVYIAFLDSDDIWVDEKKLEIQLQQIQDKNADLVFSEAYIFTNSILNPEGLLNTGKGFFSGKAGLREFLEQNKILPSSVLAKSEIINSVKGFTENPAIPQAEDYHLWLKLLMNNYILFGSELVLSGYRIHVASDCYSDRLVIPKTLEAFEDLKVNYKAYIKIINYYHKKWFIRYHYSTNNWNKKQYRELIKKNCLYISSPVFNFLFQTTYTLFGFEFTRRTLNKAVNNHWRFRKEPHRFQQENNS